MANQYESGNEKRTAPQGGRPAPQTRGSDEGAREVLFWCAMTFLFSCGLWPIAIFLLVRRFTADPKKQAVKTAPKRSTSQRVGTVSEPQRTVRTKKKSAGGTHILTIIGAVIAIGGGVEFLNRLPWVMESLYGFWNCIVALGWVSGGLAMIWGADMIKRRKSRYSRYMAVIGSRRAVAVDELVGVMQLGRKKVLRDLDGMLAENWLGEGAYVDAGRGVLFLDARAAEEYTAAQKQSTPQETEETCSDALRAIRTANDRIADAVVSEKIERLETLAGRILKEVEEHPQKEGQARRFLNYYLPTTRKILESYADFDAAGIDGENLTQAKLRIEQTLDALVEGFEHQLDALYMNEARDIDSEIRVMETMLARDTASAARDFGLGGAAVRSEKN
ncbi:MAG: 5-bromo-4-chloroindolyl phosphate hydrolysis family protein [Oscillospiraceae bacterium]|nr:5-bromo-4-chloroindolyl phosphate hydrolysis family protein [Oscillospiraceae bacterium]